MLTDGQGHRATTVTYFKDGSLADYGHAAVCCSEEVDSLVTELRFPLLADYRGEHSCRVSPHPSPWGASPAAVCRRRSAGHRKGRFPGPFPVVTYLQLSAAITSSVSIMAAPQGLAHMQAPTVITMSTTNPVGYIASPFSRILVLPPTPTNAVASVIAERLRLDRAKPRSEPFVGSEVQWYENVR